MISLDTAIEYLQLAPSNTGDVNIVEQLINEVTDIIEYETQTKILVTNVTTNFIGDGYKYYKLNCFKCNSITSIKYRETLFDSWTTLANTEYVLTYQNNSYSIVFKNELKNDYYYEIITSQGVELQDVPSDLQKVAKEMVYTAYRDVTRDYLGKSNIGDSSLGSSLNTTLIDLKDRWKYILKKYTYKRMTSGNI
jgi:hypothetical protein